jgi:hypothetical protein
MSRVYFHSPSGNAELLGSERAWLGQLCSNLALGVLSPRSNWRELSRFTSEKLPASPGYDKLNRWEQDFGVRMRVSWDDGYLNLDGHLISEFQLVLNTALAAGNDAIKLAARIHGQCEIHGYVEGPDRFWLAGVIENGLASGIFRREMRPLKSDDTYGDAYSLGWPDVIEFLASRDDEPVVMSYSVCDDFPNRNASTWQPSKALEGTEYEESGWCQLSDEEKWRYGMEYIRDKKARMLRLDPADWATMRFGHCLTVFDLLAPDAESRVAEALK